MPDETLTITLIGGPTALLEVAGLRLLTDPTFDAPGEYASGSVTLTKTAGPALEVAALGRIDAVLLSHDQHADNLDPSGRAVLATVPRVLTTRSGAVRLGGNAQGLAPWQSVELPMPDGRSLRVTATPARHGPAGIEPITGEVIGFVLTYDAQPDHAIYLTGDTVWFSGVAEVAKRFTVTVAMPFAGAAQTRGPFHLTMNASDVIETASTFPQATIVPLHHQGWAHFTQSQKDIANAFATVGITDRLYALEPGVAATLNW
jgi:L-ascorbate metabolism protein UlaG (beta-lactamase superfamily)